MAEPGQGGSRRRYRAFVSYANADKRLALRLHRALERYRIPAGITDAGSPDRRLGRIFLDRHELAASDRLGAAIEGALDDSDALILVASPDAARSFWVAQEIEHFCKGPPRPILALIARGRPNAAAAEQECFPEQLRQRAADQQPLAGNLPEEGFARAFLRLVGGLIGVPFDRLWQRERRRLRQQRAALGATVAVTAAVVATAVTFQQMRLDRQALVAASASRARDGWQNAWRPDYFSPALRDAISAARLAPDGPSLSECDLSQPVEHPVCALALSGRALPSTLLHGTPPDDEQGNIRRDIEDASTHRRRMITAQTHPRAIALSKQPFR
ncbi:MAG: toll/interleukin-1 receptor domain-containing protein, partial [Pseudomonadota bacterium]